MVLQKLKTVTEDASVYSADVPSSSWDTLLRSFELAERFRSGNGFFSYEIVSELCGREEKVKRNIALKLFLCGFLVFLLVRRPTSNID